MSGRSLAGRLVCLATCAGLIGGCTQTRVEMVATYHPGTPARVDRTPDVGVYKIKFAAGAAGEKLHTLHGSKRFLGKGQPLGFIRGEAGEIIAVAGEERFPAKFPDDTRFCVWYTKTEEQSDFGRGTSDFARGTGDVLKVAAIGVAAVGVLAVMAALHDDDCRHGVDRDKCRKCHR